MAVYLLAKICKNSPEVVNYLIMPEVQDVFIVPSNSGIINEVNPESTNVILEIPPTDVNTPNLIAETIPSVDLIDGHTLLKPPSVNQNLPLLDSAEKQIEADSVTEKWDMLVGPGQAALANYLLTGSIPSGIFISERDGHRVRQIFAGTKELADMSILGRFKLINRPSKSAQKLNNSHSKNAMDVELPVELLKNPTKSPEAACNPDAPQKVYYLSVDGDPFFPERGVSTAPAKAKCLGCIVMDECLDAALERSERFGIYGGLSERQRIRVKRAKSENPDTDVDSLVAIARQKDIRMVRVAIEKQNGQSAVEAFDQDYKRAQKNRARRKAAKNSPG